MLISLAMRYLSDHWHGRQGLAWSVWVNLVLVRIAVILLQDWLSPGKGVDYSEYREIVMILVLIFHVILFVWQAVGVLRAGDAHIRSSGFVALVWGGQLAVVLCLFWVIIGAIDAWRMTLPAPNAADIFAEMDAERAARYSLEPAVDGRSLMLRGTIELGVSERLTQMLEAFPEVDLIAITSPGGNIFEARGLARIIRERGLNTLAEEECSSACTMVFIGGISRQLAEGGRLGFHQYRFDASYPVLGADLQQQQERDRAIFAGAGVSEWFLDRMFSVDSAQMWFPDITELRSANVVNATAGAVSSY